MDSTRPALLRPGHESDGSARRFALIHAGAARLRLDSEKTANHLRPACMWTRADYTPASPSATLCVILETINQRLRDSLLLPDSSKKTVHAAAAHLAETLGDNGAWADLPSPEASAPAGGGPGHLERVLTLVRARPLLPEGPDDPALRALDFWLAHDFQSADWRQNQIEVPRLLGGIALLAEPGISPGARGKVIEILARSRWARWVPGTGWVDWTGVHRLRMAHNILLRGCLEDSPVLAGAAFEGVFREIRLARPGEEGIQADMSFHSPEASAAGDGLAFTMECARFVALAHGTPWQASSECMKQFVTYLLDGQQWVIRQGVIDYGAPDGGVAQGPRNLDGLAVVVEQLAQLANPPRRLELAALARRLYGRGDPLVGHRRFWRSDLVVHQRPGFYASLRLGSTRVAGAEPRPGNGAGSPPTGGLTYVLRSGREYQHLTHLWDRRMLPGTTTLQPESSPAAEVPATREEGATFVGGVSEGDYGMAAMELARDGLQARKAWFFFDQSFVCLGSRLQGEPADRAVYTSVNQCELHGPVVAVTERSSARTLAPGQEHDLSGARRVEHDGIIYHFPEPTRVKARLGAPGMAGPGREVLSLWIDHGPQPRSAAYAYTVLPVGDDSGAAARAGDEIGQIEVLANTASLQAVRHRGLRLLGIAFWDAGLLALPGGGRVAANRPCLLLCREGAAAGTRLSMANPLREAAAVHIEYAGRCVCFELPGGSDAGRSVSRLL